MQQQEDNQRIELKSWSAVGVWKWNIKEDRCAIDKQSLFGPCLECEAKGEFNDCKIEQGGQCDHAFHHHCIQRWLQQSKTCPMCSKPWIDPKIL